MKRLFWTIFLAALTAVWTGSSPVLAQDTPTAYVRSILDQAMSVQNNPSLDQKARAQAIHRIIEQNFDFPMMAKNALGPTYDRVGSGQRQEFTNIFSYLFQDSYTRLVLNFLKKENVDYKHESREGSKAKVDTAIVRPNESIPVTYLMHTAPRGWILYDVVVDGVSILHNYQTQFGQVISTKSFGYLLGKMREQRRAVE
jgi:phospholipid transport system substrate-binding protein